MATSRRSIPAVPSVVGTTDDASRGGLFVRSNLANPVSGADVNGIAVNDGTITISINGEEQSFTTNQATDQTLTFTVEGGGNGMADGVVTGGSFDPNTGTLTLNRDNNLADVTITGFAFTQRSDAEINALADARIAAAEIGNLSDVADSIGTAGQVLRVNTAGDALEYADTTSTVTGGTSTATPVANTPLTITIDANGVPTLTVGTPPTPPTPAAGATPNFMEPAGNAFAAPAPPAVTFTADAGTTITGITGTITGPGNTNVMATGQVLGGGSSGRIDFPASDPSDPTMDYAAPGTYTVTTMTTGTNADGDTNTETDTDTFIRFLPFYQSRTDITTGTELTAATASDAAFDNMLTAIDGSGVLFFGVPAALLAATTGVVTAMSNTGFPVRYASLREISVTDASGNNQMYRIFRAPVNGGVILTF